jgi:6-phosphogluconolactonase
VPHPRLPLLYATQETEPGSVIVVEMRPDGSLSERQRLASGGGLPCHLAIDAPGAALVASNYLDGVVTAWRLGPDGAVLEPPEAWRLRGSGPVLSRQEGPHAHMALIRRNSLLVADLGGDSIARLSREGAEVELRLPAGFGPRHFVPARGGLSVVVGELSGQIALVALRGPRSRVLDAVAASGRPDAQPSGITVCGGQIIVANRVAGTMALFSIEQERLVRGREIDLPGASPRAITTLPLRPWLRPLGTNRGQVVLVCLQDAGLIAGYSGGVEEPPQLTPVPHVSCLEMIPWPG